MLKGDYDEARVRLEHSIALWRATDHLPGLGRALRQLGSTLARHGDVAAAERWVEESLTVLRNSASTWDLGIALSTLGMVARLQGRSTDAAALYQESAGILRAIPDPWSLSYPLRALASLAASAHDHERAERYWRESLPLLLTSGENWQLAFSIKGIAETSFVRGDHARAVRLFAAAEALEENAETPRSFAVQNESSARCIDELRRLLGASLFSSLWDQGRKLSRDEIFALASGLAASKARRVRLCGNERRSHGANLQPRPKSNPHGMYRAMTATPPTR